MNIDQLLVSRCAPTLAGLKMAALVCIPIESLEAYQEMVTEYNKRFNHFGIYFKTLWTCHGRKVLYLYRIDEIRRCLRRSDVTSFLHRYNYPLLADVESTIEFLIERFEKESTFPHELGVFLGYPLNEVIAFIEHGGNGGIMCGEWKVYHDAEYAIREFNKYEVCRQCYINVFNQGFSIERLIIA